MDRLQKEERERQRLHPAAAKAGDSAGRVAPEEPDRWRTAFERDRDRIIHSSAFRRLEYKTQVFINHVGDNHRTRLTHSLEVCQVARSLAWALDLNEALVESVALAHDVGHPPFGHTGEDLLNKKMADHGGFAHNRQATRVVELLEERSPDYTGLNLTAEVRVSLKKHEEAVDPHSFQPVRFPLLEAQLVDLADSTAYHYHDVDDGTRAGILDPIAMKSDLPIWAEACARVEHRYPQIDEAGRLFFKRAANEMLGMAISDIQSESLRRLEKHQPKTSREAQGLEERCLAHSDDFRSEVAKLHRYLYDNFYSLDVVKWNIRRATDLMDRVFDKLIEQPDRIPELFRDKSDDIFRAVCDYVAGMTDRYVDRIARDLGILPG